MAVSRPSGLAARRDRFFNRGSESGRVGVAGIELQRPIDFAQRHHEIVDVSPAAWRRCDALPISSST